MNAEIENFAFMVWSAYVYRYQANKSGGLGNGADTVQKQMADQDDELSKIDTPDKHNESDLFDENGIKDDDVLDRVTKRFSRIVPLDKINVLLLCDMSHKHASIEQFEPMQGEFDKGMDGEEE